MADPDDILLDEESQDDSSFGSFEPGVLVHEGYVCTPFYVPTAASIPMSPVNNTTVYTAISNCGPKLNNTSVILSSYAWDSDLTQEVYVSGITDESCIMISPSESGDNYDNYCNNGIRAISQGTDAITFKCRSVPQDDITVNLVYWQ